MPDVSLAELHATLIDIAASAAVMQSEIKALISTHPNPEALRSVFLQEIEKHTVRALALPVPEALLEGIEALAKRALKDMPGGADQPVGVATRPAVVTG